MRQVLQFDRPTKAADLTGGQDETYTNWFSCRGSATKMNGYRAFQSGYDTTVNVYVIYIPWRNEIESGLNKDVFILFEGRRFGIDNFSRVDEDRNLIRIEAKEIR